MLTTVEKLIKQMQSAPPVSLLLTTALSLSAGWGIRGNFGHETGAMIPGALAAMAAVLLSGREDWWNRIAYFAFFGALGWSFGGSISYMQVIAYTHSGHSMSVLYGFACLFVIGFLWAAMGGAGTALPACLDRERLTAFFPPLTAIFIGWCVQDWFVDLLLQTDPQFRHRNPLYWYDSNWLGVLVAMFSVLLLAAIRRRIDSATSLVLHMAVGWWSGFLLLVVLLGWRMTPPRGDNWAGCVGMVAGMLIYFQRQGLRALTFNSLVAGFIGGLGFAGANMLKLAGIKTGWETNWHSLLEQSYGFINGLGIALALWLLARRLPPALQQPPVRRWTEPYSIAFVLLSVTYLNLRKNVGTWTKAGAIPNELYGMSAEVWFNLGYGILAFLVICLLLAHQRRPISIIPTTALGRAQLLYLVFLWWIVVGNFERALVSFAPQRLVTEGVIYLNAALCTALVLLAPEQLSRSSIGIPTLFAFPIRKIVLVGLAVALITTLADWEVVRALYGNQAAGHAGLHIRFGPNATATKSKPAPDKPHP